MKKIILLSLFSLKFFLITVYGQIPSNFYGVNYWMPQTIGTTNWNGHVTDLMPDLQLANVKIIRVGGAGYDDGGDLANFTSDYVTACTNIKNIGAEPLVQIPVKYNGFAVTVPMHLQSKN